MTARRTVFTVRVARGADAEDKAHAAVDAAKRALGEGGALWSDDDAPDLDRHMVRTKPYAEWFAGLVESERWPPDRRKIAEVA